MATSFQDLAGAALGVAGGPALGSRAWRLGGGGPRRKPGGEGVRTAPEPEKRLVGREGGRGGDVGRPGSASVESGAEAGLALARSSFSFLVRHLLKRF